MFVKSVESLGNQGIQIAKRSVLSGMVFTLQTTGVLDKFGEDVTRALPQVVKIHGITEEFKENFLDLTAAGFIPEGYFGHFTHLDHVVLSDGLNVLLQLVREAGLENRLNRFATTLASSVPGGQQSPLMGALYPVMEAYVNARGVDFIAFTRTKKDVERFQMKPRMSEKRPLISKVRQKNVGIAIPAGDSVEPGRHAKGSIGDNIKGLQKIEGQDLVTLYTTIERYSSAYFLPIAISKTWLYFNSDTLLPTPEALATFYYSENIAGVSVADIINQRRVSHHIGIDITFGMPITAEEMASQLGSNWRGQPEDVNLFLMTRQASLLPEYARGYYGQFVQG